MDELLMVTKACLHILNAKEAAEGTFLNAGIQELHFLGQGIQLDEYSKAYLEYLFFTCKRGTVFSFSLLGVLLV